MFSSDILYVARMTIRAMMGQYRVGFNAYCAWHNSLLQPLPTLVLPVHRASAARVLLMFLMRGFSAVRVRWSCQNESDTSNPIISTTLR